MFINNYSGEIKVKNTSCIKIICLVAVLASTNLFGGAIRSQGSSGAAQLLIPVGAQNLALGGANVSLVSGVSALYVNPAGTSGLEGSGQATVSNMTYLADIGITYAGLVSNLGSFGTVGLSIKTLDFGDIPVTTADETEGTGAFYSPNFLTLTTNYSRQFSDNARFGVNMKVISEQIMNTTAKGFCTDLGVQYAFEALPISVGIALKNLGGRMTYDGSDLEQNQVPAGSESGTIVERFRIQAQSFELPALLDIGLTYQPIGGLELMGAFTNNSASTNTLNFAGKYSMKGLWVGGGMSTASIIGDQGENTDEQWTDKTESLYGASFGAGVSVPLGELKLDISYSLRTVNNYFENNNILEMTIGF